MADETDDAEKTEDATPKRRREAREKGQVANSTEFVAAISLAAALGVAFLGGRRLLDAAGQLVVRSARELGARGTRERGYGAGRGGVGGPTTPGVLPPLALIPPLVAVGMLVSYGQVGFQFAPRAVALDAAKLDPIKGMQRMLGLRGVVRTALASAKILFIATAVSVVAWNQLPNLAALFGADVRPAVGAAVAVALRATIAGLIAILLLALIDLVYQRWQHEKDMRMSKKELREEWKSLEGDPHLKARIRRLQREMATSRMMDDVPKATVIVTNPTHFAVALLYDRDAPDGGGTPVVVAKGVDHLALRIRSVASDAGVPVVENPPLARGLHAAVEIGEPIPEAFYKAVAEVLSYVYRLQGELVGARRDHGELVGARRDQVELVGAGGGDA